MMGSSPSSKSGDADAESVNKKDQELMPSDSKEREILMVEATEGRDISSSKQEAPQSQKPNHTEATADAQTLKRKSPETPSGDDEIVNEAKKTKLQEDSQEKDDDVNDEKDRKDAADSNKDVSSDKERSNDDPPSQPSHDDDVVGDTKDLEDSHNSNKYVALDKEKDKVDDLKHEEKTSSELVLANAEKGGQEKETTTPKLIDKDQCHEPTGETDANVDDEKSGQGEITETKDVMSGQVDVTDKTMDVEPDRSEATDKTKEIELEPSGMPVEAKGTKSDTDGAAVVKTKEETSDPAAPGESSAREVSDENPQEESKTTASSVRNDNEDGKESAASVVVGSEAGTETDAGKKSEPESDLNSEQNKDKEDDQDQRSTASEEPEEIKLVRNILMQRKKDESDNQAFMDGWFNWIEDLLEYHTEHGHCQVRDSENRTLYNWLKRQRVMLRKGKLEAEKLRILQLLKTNGFELPFGNDTDHAGPLPVTASDMFPPSHYPQQRRNPRSRQGSLLGNQQASHHPGRGPVRTMPMPQSFPVGPQFLNPPPVGFLRPDAAPIPMGLRSMPRDAPGIVPDNPAEDDGTDPASRRPVPGVPPNLLLQQQFQQPRPGMDQRSSAEQERANQALLLLLQQQQQQQQHEQHRVLMLQEWLRRVSRQDNNSTSSSNDP